MKLPGILDVLFPKRCVNCRRLGAYFCSNCTKMIQVIEVNESICPVCERPAIDGATHPRCQSRYALDGLTSFFRYDGTVRKAIKSIKYRFVSDLAHEFIDLILDTTIPYTLSPKPYTLIPIPLHPSRFRFRGFNQAEVLGKLLATRLRIRMRPDILMRSKNTMPQVEMRERNDRLQNMKDVFSIHNSCLAGRQAKFIIHNSTFLLFDDVFTTGATMRSAGGSLKRAGANFVWAVTMAR